MITMPRVLFVSFLNQISSFHVNIRNLHNVNVYYQDETLILLGTVSK